MANLSVRKIDDDLYEGFRVQAAHHGVSMEEEVRRILKRAVAAPVRLGDLALKFFGEEGIELTLPRRRPHQPVRFRE